MRDKGRIDWMPKLGVWKAVLYIGFTDREIGRYASREDAVRELQQAIRALQNAIKA